MGDYKNMLSAIEGDIEEESNLSSYGSDNTTPADDINMLRMGNYKNILSAIEGDIEEESGSSSSGSDNTTTADDAIMLRTVKMQFDYEREYRERDRLYSVLLGNYINIYNRNSKDKRVYKIIFFIMVSIAFMAIIIFSSVAICRIMKMDASAAQVAAVAIGSFGSIISALVVIPKIIAEHLFPKNDETHMIDMVKNMQINDSKIREYHHKENDKW